MQKSGFFNALLNNGEYDRKYNANDYADNLAVIISNGVLRSNNDDLKVTSSGMRITVGVGRAWIEGHYYNNDTPHTFNATVAPLGGARYDRVFLRLNKNVAVRSVSLVYVEGETANNPPKPAPIRSGDIYDLVIADVYVGTNATSLIVTDTRADADLCGWVYSTKGDETFFKSLDNAFNDWFGSVKDTLASTTLFQRYNFRYVTKSAKNTVQFVISQYNKETCFLEVFVNGLLMTEGVDYTIEYYSIIFTNELIANTEVEVKCYKSIDGTGINSVMTELTALQNAVAKLNVTGEYDYICNGIDDNVKLSEIAQTWLTSGTDNGSSKINVCGNFGATAAVGGNGTGTSPFRWLNVGLDATTNRRIIFDFSRCGQISLPIAGGTYNNIFHGHNAHIIGANVVVNQTAVDTIIRVFSSSAGAVYAENCRFWLTAYRDSRIAQTGTFNNCRASVANITNNSYCFLPFTESLLRVNGGEYYSYTGGNAFQSSLVGVSSANAVVILNGVNMPTLARSGFYQTNSVLQWTGGGMLSCTDLVSELPLIVVAGISNIRGTITKSKAGLM